MSKASKRRKRIAERKLALLPLWYREYLASMDELYASDLNSAPYTAEKKRLYDDERSRICKRTKEKYPEANV